MSADRTLWAQSGALKIARASEHIASLEAEITAFHRRNPYTIVSEKEADTGDIVQRVRVLEQPPIRLALIAGDAIHNLRATLDLLVHQLVLANGSVPTAATAFPIRKTAAAFDQDVDRLVEGASEDVIAAIKELKPYQGGNDTLWLLHRLDILDKHQVLVPGFSRVGTTYFDMNAWPRAQADTLALSWPPEDRAELLKGIQEKFLIGINWAEPLCPVADGAEVARIPAKDIGLGDMTPRIRFEIAFGVEPAMGKEMVSTLRTFRETVERIAANLVPLIT